MPFNFSISFGATAPTYSNDDRRNYFYRIVDAFTGRFKRKRNYNKLTTVLESPAVLFVFKLIADCYKVGKYNSYVNEKLDKSDFLYSQAKKPNVWQTWTDFDENYIFAILLGTAYIYEQNGVMYVLREDCIELSRKQRESFQTLTFSKYGEQSQKNIKKGSFKYKIGNSIQVLDLSNLHIIQDTSGVNGDWWCGISRLDALYGIITNSNLAISSEDVNLEFSQKFLVSGQHDANDITSQMMGKAEQDSLEKNAHNPDKNLFSTGSRVDLHHFVDKLADLKLDQTLLCKIFLIGKMYGVPKDVLEMSLTQGATFENQEKAQIRFSDSCLKPLGQKLTDVLEEIYGVEDLRKEFSHLAFNKIFDEQRANIKEKEIKSLELSRQLGLSQDVVIQKLNEIWGV